MNISFEKLIEFLQKTPAVELIGKGVFENGMWWVKFRINITNKLAWKVVQEIGFVVNYVSLDERLPTVFYPVSPPPYLNGGPEEYLSWVIESKSIDFQPDDLTEWLVARLPSPVDDLTQWEDFEDVDSED